MSGDDNQLRGAFDENTTANTSRPDNTPVRKHINTVLNKLGKHLLRFADYDTPQLQEWLDELNNAPSAGKQQYQMKKGMVTNALQNAINEKGIMKDDSDNDLNNIDSSEFGSENR